MCAVSALIDLAAEQQPVSRMLESDWMKVTWFTWLVSYAYRKNRRNLFGFEYQHLTPVCEPPGG